MNEYVFIGREIMKPAREKKPRSFDMELSAVPDAVFYFVLVAGLIAAVAIG